jgi:hypothetical protein
MYVLLIAVCSMVDEAPCERTPLDLYSSMDECSAALMQTQKTLDIPDKRYVLECGRVIAENPNQWQPDASTPSTTA